MNPEELFDKLIHNKISRDEFEQLLAGLDDVDILARYEIYLQSQLEKEVEKSIDMDESESEDNSRLLTITKSISPKKSKKTDFQEKMNSDEN